MCDLEEIDCRQAAGQELRIDLLLDISDQQESMPVHLAEQHDRNVVDARTAVRGPFRDGARVRPQHAKAELVHRQAVARRERSAMDVEREQLCIERSIPWARADHAGLEDLRHGVSIKQGRKPGRVVLVWVGQNHDVNSTVPWWQMLVQSHEESPRIRTAVHEESTSAPALDEDRVPLPHVEHRDARDPVRSLHNYDGKRDHRRRESAREQPTTSGTPP